VLGVERTAGPSTSLRFGRDDKFEERRFQQWVLRVERTAGPSTSLRFGRDDKFESGAFKRQVLVVERRNFDLANESGHPNDVVWKEF
jgi:hypothetical protein